jgi:putative nucleotidyltransferase with HDIG domain
MIQKIDVSQLQLGMYVQDLNCSWMDHPFLRRSFLLDSAEDLATIRGIGVRDVLIDTLKGLSPQPQPVRTPAQPVAEVAQAKSEAAPRMEVAEELSRAKQVFERTGQVVRDVMHDVRLGKAVQVSGIEAVVEDITASVARNSGALLSLVRLKDADDYTFLHCVAVGTLMVTFARSLDLDPETVRQAGIGGLLHDVGKMSIPDVILNKPGRLTDEEFAVIRRHPSEGHRLLVDAGTVGDIPRDITLHHHERMDGSGYPERLPGERISLLAKMAAIVDVYDAITSDRCYHKGVVPTTGLAKLFEWSEGHFERGLVQKFMQTVGIYPTGTLVRLQSGRLAVVIEQCPASLITPVVRVCYSTKSNAYVPPERIELAHSSDRIVGGEEPRQWGIDAMRFVW